MEHLSTGILNRIIRGETVNEPIVLQFLGSKPATNNRYRLYLSDGETVTSYSILTPSDLDIIKEGLIVNFAICKVTDYVLTKSKNFSTPIIVIRNIEVITQGDEIGSILGNPITYEPKVFNIKENIPVQDEVQENGNQSNFQNGVNIVPIMNQSTESNFQNEINNVPITNLGPYYGKWIIRARIASKSEIRYWNNARGQGKLFSMDLIDESGEIRCTGFNEEVDTFYDLFETRSIYYISNCQVKPADKRFTTIKHEFEIVLKKNTAILRYEGDDLHIPMIQFDFSMISDIGFKENGSVTDVLAIVKTVGELVRLKSKKTGADLTKRDIILVDDSNTMIALTLWGAQAEEFNTTDGTPLAIKTVTISEFNRGKSLSTCSSTIIQANPVIPGIERLMTWFEETDRAKDAKMLSNSSLSANVNCPWLNFKEAEEQGIGRTGTVNTFLTKASIGSIKSQNALYKSCPVEGCKKKVLDPVNGMYQCLKCNNNFPNYIYRMIVQATLLDFSQELNVTIFQNEAEQILNKCAQEIGEIYENLSIDNYEDVFTQCTFKTFIFKISMRQDNFNNSTKVRAVVTGVSPVDKKDYSSHLVKGIKKILEKQSS